MPDFNTIKSYLVSLGPSVDKGMFDKFNETIGKLGKIVEKHTSGLAKNYALAGSAIVGTLATITGAVVTMMDKVSQADLGYQKFALRMYMNADAAKSMKVALDAMGESIQDIAWMPELRERYASLLGEERKMALPGDFESQMRYLRDIRFEFTRMKVEATYGLQWVGHYLFKYLAEPITGIRGGLAGLNDYIVAKMPEWSNAIAGWLTRVVDLGKSAWRVLFDLAGVFKRIWDILPPLGKEIIILGGIITAVFVAGPFGKALLIMSGLLLLVDDFFAYIDGRKSSRTLAPIWDMMISVLEKIAKGALIAVAAIDRLQKIGIKGIIHGTSQADQDAFNKSISDIINDPNILGLDRSKVGAGGRGAGAYGSLIGRIFGSDAGYANSIMMRESGGSPNATHVNHNGTTDYGLFQINTVNIPDLKKAGIIGSESDLFDPAKNVAAAGYLYNRYGWHPWDSSLPKGAPLMASHAPTGAGAQISMGDINVTVTQSNASADDIARAVQEKVMAALDRNNQRLQMEVGGVHK